MTPAPPIAPRHPRVTTLHGVDRADDYAWLRDKDDPEVIAYLNAENAYADAFMAPTDALRQTLYDEILGRIEETDLSVPYREGDFYYYRRTEAGEQYPILCRKVGSLDAAEQVILDVNELAKGKPFMALGAVTISGDGNTLAYSIDDTGFRDYALRVVDLVTGEHGPECRERVKSLAWAADHRTLFYTVDDDTKRPYRIYRHALGAPHDDDTPIYEDTDQRFRVVCWRSRSRAYVFVASASHTASEVHVLDAAAPDGPLRVVCPRRDDHEYDVDHRGDRFYIRTNDADRNFRVVTAPVAAPGPENWRALIPHADDVMISGFEAFADHWVIRERRDGLPHLRVGRYDGASWRIPMPEPVYSVSGEANPEFETDVYRYRYESFITPPSVMQVEVATGASTLLKETPVLGDYDRRAYTTERIWATASDGARVPISLVYRTDGAGDGAGHSTGHSTGHSAGHSAGDAGGPRPLHLTGYGAYGFAYPVVFSHARVSLLDRGVVCAVAHVRGGGELGKPWHDAGRMRHKRNTFTDFIAAAEHLVSEGRTAPDRLVIQGASAGGLLMGAVVNTRPDLARIAVAQVPFVDVLNTMLDDSLPLTVGEYEEWGDPNQPDDFAYIASYCPYTNVAAHDYPTLLVKTSLHDSQVMYWEPAKWVAKLRAHKTDDNPLVFHTNMEAGHGGSSGRYDKLREVAFDYAFVLWQLGVERVE